MDDLPAASPPPGFVPVCAIGASAGGVGALQTLFKLLPDDLGLAYVVVIHLSPDHPSSLHEILGAATHMPVFQVEDGPTLQANNVYVIPPDRELVIEGDNVRSRPFSDPRARRAPIDMFFRSVAASRGDGVAVVLTGAGSDGAVGVRAIKEAGGIIMVQEPAEAGFPSMPQNAIATGVADVVAPLARLAERIAEAARSKEAVRSLDEDGVANDVRRIIAFLRTRTGHDFSGYKRSTVLRRISRRMQVCQILGLANYARHLRDTPEEAEKLFSDLLISVTTFFRDPEAFVALSHKVVRPGLEAIYDGNGADELRAWVVGCATGEEAYSLAIVLLEETEALKVHVPIQIFATDLDEGALATAREGRYPRTIEADVSAERLKRFFVDEGTHYRISRRVRDLVLFATHSVVREPPFMRLDLITCRNVLIYLERALQQHVCAIFHYGLMPGGCLFLGTAETLDASQNQFAAVDREARLFRALPSGTGLLPILPPAPAAIPSRPAVEQGRAASSRIEAGEILGVSHAAALEASAPPSALVDADQAVLHLSPTAGRFILLSAGPLSGKLPSIVRPELRLDLKLALDRVFELGQPTITRTVDVALDGALRRVSAHVAPVPAHEGLAARAIVYFLDNGPARPADAAEEPPRLDDLQHLHSELKAAQEAELSGRIRHETATQELRASNEELQSLNEEYRSTAEELETSKEELQSINEELQTVNAELKNKLAVISAAHNDLQNLTASSEIGTLFLDTDLRIRMFTPPVAELINVAQADVGRPITNFTSRLDYGGFEHDLRRVLRDLAQIEKEIAGPNDSCFTVRIRPYRTLDNKVEGAVVTFDDITARKRGEEALRESEDKYRTLFESIDEGFCVLEMLYDAGGEPRDCRYVQVNPAFLKQTGQDDPTGKLGSEYVPASAPMWLATYDAVVRSGEPVRFEQFHPDSGRWYSVYASVIGERGSRLIASVFADVTVRKNAEAVLRESEERQAFLLSLADALRPLEAPQAIMQAATKLLRAQIAATRCAYYEIEGDNYIVHSDSCEGVSSLLGRYPIGAFGSALLERHLAGQSPMVVDDIASAHNAAECKSFAAIQVGAYVNVTLVKQGRFVAGLTLHSLEPRVWTATNVALAQETAERTWAAIERARAETALRESEQKYRSLFGSIDEGYCLVEIIRDTNDDPVDMRYLEFNENFERQTGLRDVAGKSHADLGLKTEPHWFERYGNVARTGVAARFESYHEPTGRWYDVFATPFDASRDDRVVLVFDDVTERKQRELDVEFLDQIGTDLARLSEPNAIMAAVGARLGDYLGTSGCVFVDVDEDANQVVVHYGWTAEGIPNLMRTYRLSDYLTDDFTRASRAGEAFVIRDTANDPRAEADAFAALKIGAVVTVPYIAGGRWTAYCSIVNEHPRDWRPHEIALLGEVSQRLFARVVRARAEIALRESEASLARELANTKQLQAVSSLLIEGEDDEALYGRILDAAMAIMHSDFASLQRFDPERSELQLLGQRNFHPDSAKAWNRISISTGTPCGGALSEGERLFTLDAATYDPEGAEYFRLSGIGSCQSTPLTARDGRLIGMMSTHWRTASVPAESDYRSFDVLVRQTADAFERASAEAALRASEERQRMMVDLVPALLWSADPEGRVVVADLSWKESTGQRDADVHAFGWLDAVYPDDREATRAAFEHAFATGEPLERQHRILTADGYRWHLVRHIPVRDASGTVVRWFGAAIDVHDLHELQDRQEVLVGELQHRTRNLIGVVRSTMEATLRSSTSLDEFSAKYRDRVDALARVQTLLSRLSSRDRVTFDQLIRDEMSALGVAERVVLAGPNGVPLRSSSVQTFALALHELATNALKYGALKQPSGRLAITWSVETSGPGGKPWLHVDWHESGVLLQSADDGPRGGGQGRLLIERALPYQLGAITTFVMGPDGVRCSIALPVSSEVGAEETGDGPAAAS